MAIATAAQIAALKLKYPKADQDGLIVSPNVLDLGVTIQTEDVKVTSLPGVVVVQEDGTSRANAGTLPPGINAIRVSWGSTMTVKVVRGRFRTFQLIGGQQVCLPEAPPAGEAI